LLCKNPRAALDPRALDAGVACGPHAHPRGRPRPRCGSAPSPHARGSISLGQRNENRLAEETSLRRIDGTDACESVARANLARRRERRPRKRRSTLNGLKNSHKRSLRGFDVPSLRILARHPRCIGVEHFDIERMRIPGSAHAGHFSDIGRVGARVATYFVLTPNIFAITDRNIVISIDENTE